MNSMKPRRVVLTIEIESGLAVSDLKARARDAFEDVRQVQANVMTKRAKKARRKRSAR